MKGEREEVGRRGKRGGEKYDQKRSREQGILCFQWMPTMA